MNILVISAHPDDETLGCGGTLLKHKADGDKLFWLIVTTAHVPQWSQDSIADKATEVRNVANAYGVERYFHLEFPTTELETIPLSLLIEKIREVIVETIPEVVYLVHEGDVHSDHRIVYSATMSVLKSFYMGELSVSRVLSYETLSSTEAAPQTLNRLFIPTVFSDITRHMERKLEIMDLYRTEIQSAPFPRSARAIKSLAGYRGSTFGVDYAEAFMLIREII